MKIAITGGTGFVGRNIARLLAGEGHEVVLVARGRTDPIPTSPAAPGAVRFVPLDNAPARPEPLPGARQSFIAPVSIGSWASKLIARVHVRGDAQRD